MMILYFKFTRTLVFTIGPTVMLSNGDSSIRCLEKNTDACIPTNPNFNSENTLSGLEAGQQKINAIADDELHNLIVN